MRFYNSCSDAVAVCNKTQTYSVAHLLNSEHTMDIHNHECCEVYYSISGGKKFMINNHLYTLEPGDIFFINCNESHQLLQVEVEKHERYVLNYHPCFIIKHSSPQTDLSFCFNNIRRPTGSKLSLTKKEQQRFLFLMHKLSSLNSDSFGADLIEPLVFLEILIFLNELFEVRQDSNKKSQGHRKNYVKTGEIVTYINHNLSQHLDLSVLSKQFSISVSHLNRIFKEETGTTLQKYITAQRIALAKTLLSDGYTVTEAFTYSGFGDYSNFYKSFTKIVGVSPKNYAVNASKFLRNDFTN